MQLLCRPGWLHSFFGGTCIFMLKFGSDLQQCRVTHLLVLSTMLYTYSASEVSRSDSAMAAQSGSLCALFVSFLPGLPMFSCCLLSHVSWLAPPHFMLLVPVFLVDYLLTVFLLSPSPLLVSAAETMLCTLLVCA